MYERGRTKLHGQFADDRLALDRAGSVQVPKPLVRDPAFTDVARKHHSTRHSGCPTSNCALSCHIGQLGVGTSQSKLPADVLLRAAESSAEEQDTYRQAVQSYFRDGEAKDCWRYFAAFGEAPLIGPCAAADEHRRQSCRRSTTFEERGRNRHAYRLHAFG